MTDTLDRIIYSKQPGENPADEQEPTLSFTGELTVEDTRLWRDAVGLDPVPEDISPGSLALGIFNGPGRMFILSRVYQPTDAAAAPIYEYIGLPRKLLQQAAGHLEPLLALMQAPLPTLDHAAQPVISPLDTPELMPWSPEERQKHLKSLLNTYANGNIARVLALLDSALDDRRLLIRNFDGDAGQRVAWVQGVMALLPAIARAEITFATYVSNPKNANTRIAFTDSDVDTERWEIGGTNDDVPQMHTLQSPYVQLLADIWNDDLVAFLQALEMMDSLAEVILPGLDLNEGLNRVAAHTTINLRILAGTEVSISDVKAIFSERLPLSDDLHILYAERLLNEALETRDVEAALIVALEMDSDPQLDQKLHLQLMEALQSQPDAVYVFIRARLNDAMESSQRWLERLQIAALASLRVAISAADSTTIINWLRLISREPLSYGLSEILRQGIFTAQIRAHDDGELARQLLILTVKRDPEIINQLLDDAAFLAVVPENMGAVLRDYNGDPLVTLQNRGPELFLVVMARAARAHSAEMFNPQTIENVWRLFTAGQTFNLPTQYQPASIVDIWVESGTGWLPNDMLQTICTLMLADGRDELFYRMASQLASQELLVDMLVTVLQSSQRNITDLLPLIAHLINNKQITQQEAVNTYIELISLREWRQIALPLVEQLARIVQQVPALDIPTHTIWRLLDNAATSRSDMVARVAARQLFNDMEASFNQEDEGANNLIVETLLRLFDQLQWSNSARQYVLNWWRDFVRSQPVARLGKLDKALDGKRALEDCRTILQSTLAFRRMLGKRSIGEFASAINIAFSVLEDIADSFDPSPRRAVSFDEGTIRAELDARKSELSDQELRILTTNFRELAQLIGEMGDHRSKANLMRRGENIDRQLMSGEQQPDSAVDVMKWVAGYLDGVQNRDDEAKD